LPMGHTCGQQPTGQNFHEKHKFELHVRSVGGHFVKPDHPCAAPKPGPTKNTAAPMGGVVFSPLLAHFVVAVNAIQALSAIFL
jgi:hypothetical protein